MTRWARGGSANKKKPLEPSSWSALKQDSTVHKNCDDNAEDHIIVEKCEATPENLVSLKKKKRKRERKEKYVPLTDSAHENTAAKCKPSAHEGTAAKCKPKKKKAKLASDDSKTSIKDDILEELLTKPTDSNSDNDGRVHKVELLEFIKKDDRREKRRLKRAQERNKKRVCFNCRESGHDFAACPKVSKDVDQGTGICFKCGSTEHTVSQCKAQVPNGKFPFAKCFICKEMGHLSRSCTHNPRGLYPNGGCCRICGSVEHFKKDCPELQKQQGIQDMKLIKMNQVKSLDEDLPIENNELGNDSHKDNQNSSFSNKKKKKVVNF